MSKDVSGSAMAHKGAQGYCKYSWIQLAGIGMHDWKQIREVFNLKKYMWISMSLALERLGVATRGLTTDLANQRPASIGQDQKLE